ncbi:MAG: GNAT family N-acetyltransferase [Alistipes sp.]
MTPILRFTPFKSCTDAGWAEAWQIYESSFPEEERWHEADYMRAFSDPAFEADGVWLQGDRLVGVLFYWKADGFRYIEHLAISAELRGQEMGSKILTLFCQQGGRVLLEIDPPIDDISIRRQHFYERLGFVTNPYEYMHPSFHKPFRTHHLVIMSYPEAVTYAEASLFADFVRERVLCYSEHENPTLPKLP